jgi:hypothetical protein
MRRSDQTVLSEVLPPEERAIEAVVARYQRVAGAVTRFARTLSGNEALHVRLGTRSAASRDEVVVDPGVFQAAYSRAAPVTASEVALVSALHEVVHLVATSFEDRRALPREWFPDDYQGELPPDEVSLLEALREAGGLAGETMFFALEDARQEAQLFAGYDGARSVLSDLYMTAVPQAMETTRPVGQFALAAFLITAGYSGRDALQRITEPHVAVALDDAAPFLARAADTTDPWEIAGLALQVLQVAKLHGLITDAATGETVAERTERTEDEAEALSDAVDRVRIVSPVLRDAEGYDDAKGAAEALASDAGRLDQTDQAGDPSTDQIVRVSEAPTVYLPTGQSGKLLVDRLPHRFGKFASEGRVALTEAAVEWGVAQRRVSGELYPLFAANQRRGLRGGYDAGDLSPYSALLLGGGLYERMFERRAVSTRRSYAVSLLVDGSASMLQPQMRGPVKRRPWAMAAATLGAWTLARLADELQIEFEVALFNRSFAAVEDDSEQSFAKRLSSTTAGLRSTQGGAADRLTRTVNHYLIKSFDDRWRAAEQRLAGLFWVASRPHEAAAAARRDPETAPPVSMFTKAANVDEFNVSHAANRLVARGASARMLVVLADGMTRGSVNALTRSISSIEDSGTTVLGIGIGDQTVESAYRYHQVVARPDALAKAMVDGVRASLAKAIAQWGGDTWWGHSSTPYHLERTA